MRSHDFHHILAKLRPVVGDLADALWLTPLLDPSQENDVQAVAQALAAELLGESYIGEHILLEPPAQQTAGGHYPLGSVMYAGRAVCPFGLRERELPQHVAILGRSGSGKTNVGYLLVWNLLRSGNPFMVLDWRRNYRHLLHRGEAREVLTLSVGEPASLCFNPLRSPSGLTMNQREAYVRDVVSILCTTYLPGHQLLSTRGVEYLLLKALQVLAAFSPESPTFNDVRRYLEEYRPRSRESDWKASADNILLKLTTGPIGRAFNSATSITPADALRRQAILELDALGSQTDRAAFAKCLLVWLFYHRLAEGRSSTAKHVLLIEEAHQCFLRRRDGQQSVPDLMLRQMRDLGQSVVILDQNPSLLSVPALGNTAATICLNLKHADDLEAAGKALTLPRDKWDYIGKLGVGQAIVKVQSRHPGPFLVRFPLFPVREKPAPVGPRPRRPQADSLKRSVQDFRTALNEAIRALRGTDTRQKGNGGMGAQERTLLADIAQEPLSVVTERYKRLNWTAHKGTKVKRHLLESGLIEQEKVRVPKGSVTLVKPTNAGEALLASWRVEVNPMPKNEPVA